MGGQAGRPKFFIELFDPKTKLISSRALPALSFVSGADDVAKALFASPKEFLLQYNDPRKPNQPNRLAKLTVRPSEEADFDALRKQAPAAFKHILTMNVQIALRMSFAYMNWPGMVSMPAVLLYAKKGAEFMVDTVFKFRSGERGHLTNGPPRSRDDAEWKAYYDQVNSTLRSTGLDLQHFMI